MVSAYNPGFVDNILKLATPRVETIVRQCLFSQLVKDIWNALSTHMVEGRPHIRCCWPNGYFAAQANSVLMCMRGVSLSIIL